MFFYFIDHKVFPSKMQNYVFSIGSTTKNVRKEILETAVICLCEGGTTEAILLNLLQSLKRLLR